MLTCHRKYVAVVAIWAAIGMALGRFTAPVAADPAAPTTAPSAFDYVNAPDNGTAAVSGTSTLHDWSAEGTAITGTARCSGPWTGTAPKLLAIQLTIPVNTLKSSEGSGMDDTMYDALKMKANPLITFTLTSANLQSHPSSGDSQYHYTASGQLTIAGAARAENLTLDVQPGDGNKLTIQTQAKLKMTDFGIKPPTAMMGMIRSGDDVTVTVTWQLVKHGQ
jgi:polyisoprenoid-binding protein YceI